MTIVGILLMVLGGIGALLFFLGLAPAFLSGTPVTFGVCAAVSVAGLVLALMTRRPAN